jgi:hypothetical protein
VAVVQRLLQQSLFCEHELPGFEHDAPPELPLELPTFVVVTVTVTQAESHELKTQWAYWSKALTPFGYCESQPQVGAPMQELTHCA